KWRASYHTPVVEYHALEIGDFVVHFHHGVGRYLGLEKEKNHLGIESEFLILEYANQSKLFVPVSQSHLVSRYIGIEEERPELHQIGSSKWQKAKDVTQKAILGYAKDLLVRQAEREITGGFAFPEDGSDTIAFGEAFPFTETADQESAISAIRQDMCSSKSMDRLIAGDVGYGKTEVAMRAAFKAVADGQKQVAVLVPTTILAMQHFETFQARFSLFPVTIGLLSRFQTKKESDEIVRKLKEGLIDIVIGTHRLLGQDIGFKDLGLVIIDEEQRFGVRAKEKLKLFKTGVDSISLSATPIPRTLYMSIIGARPMSVISSPPHDRLPIKSIMAEKEDEIIRNAFLRELARDGQGYFIHNRVESIYATAEHLQKLIPHARIGIAHGQMDSDAIEEVFQAFKQGKIDILVATTLVENGIDIPNANTILIDRADTFGISDLYQLRGRVGRWNKTAYAYFLVPKGRILPEVSQKRLNALIETSGFGGGVRLAMRDLEIRGAGDILGVQQSGHVSKIGFHLYCKLLKRTIDALKKKETASFFETKLECPFIAKFPDAYISDSAQRLEIYHRLGEAVSYEEIDAIFDELKDRFGPLPDASLFLYHLTRLRFFANKHHFTSLKFLTNALMVEKGTQKVSIPLPPNLPPKQLEEFVTAKLQERFRAS
ncbi:MAG: transcription-repair coupling factor, partial [Verrucomicrobia bacterium]|nr:transcription-repair coupling factor [Verrucomicrobiota bacterium]